MGKAIYKSEGHIRALYARNQWKTISGHLWNQSDEPMRKHYQATTLGHPRKTSVRNWLDDIYGKLPGGLLWEAIWNREDVCETVFAGYLWDIICRASVGSSQMDKCENNVSGHHFDSGRKTSVRNWLDDICGKPV